MLADNIKSHDEVLFVTHDYFQNVIAKTKLMQLTAELNKNVPRPHSEKDSVCHADRV